MRDLFEKWVVAQFGDIMKHRLSFDRMTGYSDEDVNAMWVGFAAGVELTRD